MKVMELREAGVKDAERALVKAKTTWERHMVRLDLVRAQRALAALKENDEQEKR